MSAAESTMLTPPTTPSTTKVVSKPTEKILFNYRSKHHSFLSNFHVSEMTIDSKIYFHVEGYFQSIKYNSVDKKTSEHIRNILHPHLSRSRGEKNEYLMSTQALTSWNEVGKVITMKRGLITKFVTNNDLAKLLLLTRDADLVYNDPDDEYWGNGKDNKGKNLLGKMLEEVRDIIQNLPDTDYD